MGSGLFTDGFCIAIVGRALEMWIVAGGFGGAFQDDIGWAFGWGWRCV